MSRRPLKMRHLPLVARAALPTVAPTGAPRPALLGVTGGAQLALITASGVLVRPAMGADAITPATAGDAWCGSLALTPGAAGPPFVATLSGVLRDGLGNAVVGGVFDATVSMAGGLAVVPTAVTGTLGAVVPGFLPAAAQNGCTFSFASGAAGVFNVTLTTTAGGLMTVTFRYRHLANILTDTVL